MMLAPTFEYNCEYHYVAEAQHIVHAVHTPRSGLSLVVFRCGISNKSTTDLLISFHSLSLSLSPSPSLLIAAMTGFRFRLLVPFPLLLVPLVLLVLLLLPLVLLLRHLLLSSIVRVSPIV